MFAKSLVSIITVNFNQSDITCDLLSSLRNISYQPVEVWIVDNGSQQDSPDKIGELFPEYHLIRSTDNLGFAGGNNLALKSAKGEFFLFINNDTEVEPGFLEPLVERMLKDPAIGMISPKIRFHHTPDTIQYAGYTPMHPVTLRQNLIGYHQKDTGQYNTGGYTYAVHGAAMMVSRSLIEQVGPMSEVFFLYYEEHDWVARSKKAGFKMYYEPASLVLHKESISTGKESPLKVYYLNRNRVVYTRRNRTGVVRIVAIIYLFLIAFPKGFLTYTLKRQKNLASSLCRAYAWNIRRIFTKIKD